MAAFCLCSEKWPDANLKSNGLILFVEKMSRQPNIDSSVDISNHFYVGLQ